MNTEQKLKVEPPIAKKGHMTPQMFKEGIPLEMMEHISHCDYCAGMMADLAEQNGLIAAPRDLKETVMARSRRLDVAVVAGSNQISKRLKLFYYSLKVGAAVLCTITLLAVTPGAAQKVGSYLPPRLEEHQIHKPLLSWDFYEHAESFTNKLNQFSIFHWEVNEHDKKEK